MTEKTQMHQSKAEIKSLRNYQQQSKAELADAEESITTLESTLRKLKRNSRKRLESMSSQHKREIAQTHKRLKMFEAQLESQESSGDQMNSETVPRATSFYQDAMAELVKSHREHMEFATTAHKSSLQRTISDYLGQIEELKSRMQRETDEIEATHKREQEVTKALVVSLF